MPRYDIFVSYASVHRDLVGPLVKLLQVGNRFVFLDFHSLEPGDNWSELLLSVLKRVKKVIVVWCIHASKSEWVQKEIEIAIAGKKRIIPVLLDNTPLPEPLKSFQWLPLMDVLNHDGDTPFGDGTSARHGFSVPVYGDVTPFWEDDAGRALEIADLDARRRDYHPLFSTYAFDQSVIATCETGQLQIEHKGADLNYSGLIVNQFNLASCEYIELNEFGNAKGDTYYAMVFTAIGSQLGALLGNPRFPLSTSSVWGNTIGVDLRPGDLLAERVMEALERIDAEEED